MTNKKYFFLVPIYTFSATGNILTLITYYNIGKIELVTFATLKSYQC